MPLLPMTAVTSLLACPACGSPLSGAPQALSCTSDDCKRIYPAIGSAPTPILIDSDVSIVDVDALLESDAASQIKRGTRGLLGALAVRATVPRNKTAERFTGQLATDLVTEATDRRPRLLIVGGGAVGSGVEALYADPNLDIIAFDIYRSENCHFIADGHQIPLVSGSVDGVLVQAVLEHVLNPQRVVDEIHRVLRIGGLVYADTPFMQQVHEGPYDFTRFTDSGHRYLFRRFEARNSGTVSGLGTQLHWSLYHFGRGIHRRVGQVFWAGFSWLHLLDGRLNPQATVDGASSVFFYGHSSIKSISPKEIIAYYSGAQGK